LAAAAVATVFFGSTTLLHAVQMGRHKAWFCTPFFIGGIFETVGYIGRAISSKETTNWTLGPYIMQSLLLLLAPAFFAATIYMTLGRIISYTAGESQALVKRRLLTKLFVAGDVLSFLTQSGGGGLMASQNAATRKTGSSVVVGGLFLQILFFSLFVIVAITFNIRIKKRPTERSAAFPQWQKHLNMLYATSTLILIRSVFRVVEYLGGNDGYLMHHEVFLYAFDTILMFVVMVLLNVVHPYELNQHGKQHEAWAYRMDDFGAA